MLHLITEPLLTSPGHKPLVRVPAVTDLSDALLQGVSDLLGQLGEAGPVAGRLGPRLQHQLVGGLGRELGPLHPVAVTQSPG